VEGVEVTLQIDRVYYIDFKLTGEVSWRGRRKGFLQRVLQGRNQFIVGRDRVSARAGSTGGGDMI
jgi:hypothetical protein